MFKIKMPLSSLLSVRLTFVKHDLRNLEKSVVIFSHTFNNLTRFQHFILFIENFQKLFLATKISNLDFFLLLFYYCIFL